VKKTFGRKESEGIDSRRGSFEEKEILCSIFASEKV